MQSDRTVERNVDMKLHVTVEAEELTQVVHPQAGRVSSSGTNALPLLAGRIEPEDRSGSLKENRRTPDRDVFAVPGPAAVTGYEIDVAIQATQERVGGVITTRIERFTQSPLVLQFPPCEIAAEKLNPVPAHGVDLVAIDHQSLGATSSESFRDNLRLIINLISIGVSQASQILPIPDQQPPLTIEDQVVGSPGEAGLGHFVDVTSPEEGELVVEEGGSSHDGQRHENRERSGESHGTKQAGGPHVGQPGLGHSVRPVMKRPGPRK